MASGIPSEFLDLFKKKAFAQLATIMPDGHPQVTPVWCDFDGTHIRIGSARGRVKDQNMRRDPRVTVTLQDPDNPYRYLEVRGKVVEIQEKGAAEHIDVLTKKYMGLDKFPYTRPGEVRIMYKIAPVHCSGIK